VLHRVALRTDDIDQTHAELRSQGLQVSPIVNGQRNDPQGNVISWRILPLMGILTACRILCSAMGRR
jgi:hypothetical protein